MTRDGARRALSILLVLLHFCSSKSLNVTRTQILLGLLSGPGLLYDARVPPDFEENYPTSVSVQIHVLNFNSLTEIAMEYSLSMFLRLKWTDRRLMWDDTKINEPLEVDPKLASRIWTPDVYFINEKVAIVHDVLMTNKLMHIYHNGTVRTSTKISMSLNCDMHLARYPRDEQICSIYAGIYSYSKENVVLKWHSTNPLFLRPTLILPRFSVKGYDTKDCFGSGSYFKEEHIVGEHFSCLRADFLLQREFGYYVVQVYIPCTLVVVLSWISFWIDIDAAAARVSIGLLTVLAIMTQSSGEKTVVPKVSYVTALDIWMVMSLLFTSMALLEYSLVNIQCQKHKNLMESEGREKRNKDKEEINYLERARFMDKCCKVIFPLVFLIFNIIYWTHY